MSYPIHQQIEAVKLMVAEKRGAGEAVMAEVLNAALLTLIGKATQAGAVVPVMEAADALQASLTLYKKFEAAYRTWHKKQTQLDARMDAAQGRALHGIIGFLREQSNTKDDAGALTCWLYVLDNWAKVPPFVQRQTTLTAINKYLTEIIQAIKKASQAPARVWPDQWSAAFEAKLNPEELKAYRAHLRGRGWRYDGQRQMWVAPQ